MVASWMIRSVDELFVVKGRPAIAGAPLTVLAVTDNKVEAERHVEVLEKEGFYSFIQEYMPATSKYFCSEHAVEDDSPVICKVCSEPARYVRHGEA